MLVADHARSPRLGRHFLVQEPLLFDSTLLQVDKEGQNAEAQQTQAKQEVEGQAVVAVGVSIDDGAADNGTDERRRLAHDAEQAEKQEFFTPGCHFADHDLAVGVPRTNHQAVEGLIEPELPDVMETERLGPDADHAPSI